jgi:hypothetical protein
MPAGSLVLMRRPATSKLTKGVEGTYRLVKYNTGDALEAGTSTAAAVYFRFQQTRNTSALGRWLSQTLVGVSSTNNPIFCTPLRPNVIVDKTKQTTKRAEDRDRMFRRYCLQEGHKNVHTKLKNQNYYDEPYYAVSRHFWWSKAVSFAIPPACSGIRIDIFSKGSFPFEKRTTSKESIIKQKVQRSALSSIYKQNSRGKTVIQLCWARKSRHVELCQYFSKYVSFILVLFVHSCS